ncbi:chemotaxis protein CheW [Deinococcus depolymerans]|uniref:CheW-like domain-containing protein n=1 Tax=Deinococcus depolymerans TaxID=392408 RepID=A0ABN1CA12_9DEIO
MPALLCRSGQARFYLPLTQIERVYPMVHLPAARQGGPRVHLRGETLDVQDTRGWWGQPPAEPEATQRLIVVTRPRREAWWVDEVGPLADVPAGAPHAVLDGQVLPVVWHP